MGVYANWPVGLAPGMGLNAFFTYLVVGEMGYSWEVLWGLYFLLEFFFYYECNAFKAMDVRKHSFNLRIAMGARCGLFIGIIGQRVGE